MKLEQLGIEACGIVKEVGAFIRNERINFSLDKVESKGRHDFVSYVDKTAEQRLVAGLERILPVAGFIAEEGTSTKRGEVYNWIIDPLDGTTNFIHGAPPYSVSVALMERDKLVMGMVYEITLDEMFYSYLGGAAYLNGKEIRVSGITRVSNSLIATGFPYDNYNRMKPFMKSLDFFFQESHGVRRIGSAATDLVYVACGRYDAFYEYNLQPWDVAAGAFIVMQAGGRVSDFKGGDSFLFGKELVAANAAIFNEFQQHVANYMND